MQLMADYSQRRITKNEIPELSAIGVAKFATTNSDVKVETETFLPKISAGEATTRKASWHEAINQSRMQGSNNV
jgi:glycerol kinase